MKSLLLVIGIALSSCHFDDGREHCVRTDDCAIEDVCYRGLCVTPRERDTGSVESSQSAADGGGAVDASSEAEGDTGAGESQQSSSDQGS
jgi:hypothetical protein